jgi:hypothetical protein
MSSAWNSIDNLWSPAHMHKSVSQQHSINNGDAFLTTGFQPPRTGPFLHPSHERETESKKVQALMTSGFMFHTRVTPSKESFRKLSYRTPSSWASSICPSQQGSHLGMISFSLGTPAQGIWGVPINRMLPAAQTAAHGMGQLDV